MKSKRKNKGFTLLEILIAMTILSMIFTMIYTILVGTLNAREYVEKISRVDRVGNRLLSFIVRDLQAAYIYQMEQSCFRGAPNRVDFVTNTDSLLMSSDGLRSDLCEVGYFLRPNPEEGGTFKLIRREDFFIDTRPLKGGYGIKLYDRITAMEIVYYPRVGKGRRRWDSKKNKGLPQAIEIAISMRTAPADSDPETLNEDIRVFRAFVKLMSSPIMPENKKKKKDKKQSRR